MRGPGTPARIALAAGLTTAVAAGAVLVRTGVVDLSPSGAPAAGSTAPATARASASSRVPTPAPSRTRLLPAPARAAAPTTRGLAAALAPALADRGLGRRLAASVVDVETGTQLLDHRGSATVLPASTAKIPTAVAALTALGPGARLTTRVLAGRSPGDVVLVGSGDVTLAGEVDDGDYPRPARLGDLARQATRALQGQRVTRVLIDDTAYPGPRTAPGWKPGYLTSGDVAPVDALSVDGGRTGVGGPRAADPALDAGNALARALGAATAPVVRGRAPAGARQLASVASPPVTQLVELMLTRSDNDLAESLSRQVAIAEGRPPTFEGASAAVAAVLGRVLPEQAGGFRLADGSGLSRLDRVRPAAVTALLAHVAGGSDPRLAPVLSGLPVAGFRGTLEDRFRSGAGVPAAGVVRAKTGTLSGVSALAGLVRTRSGRLLAFDLTADAVPEGATYAAERALDALAADLAGCGCR